MRAARRVQGRTSMTSQKGHLRLSRKRKQLSKKKRFEAAHRDRVDILPRLQARVNVKPTAGKPRFGAMPVGQAQTGIVLWAGVSCFAVYGFCACKTRTDSYQFGSDEC